MSRYIDADEFGRCLRNYRPYVDSGRFNAIQTEVNQVLDCIEYEIEDAPSIDIVRCGECRNRDDDYVCYKWASINECPHVKPYDFCSYGSRSEKPNNCEVKNYCDDCLYTDTCDSKEFFYACTSKATISKMEQVDEPQTEREGE